MTKRVHRVKATLQLLWALPTLAVLKDTYIYIGIETNAIQEELTI